MEHWSLPQRLRPSKRIGRDSGMRLMPDKFYEGRSQEKTHLPRLEFFLLRSPLDRARSVLTYRAICSVTGQCDPVDWVFLCQRFSSLLRDEACQFRNQQSRTVVKFGDHSSIWDSWPIAFSGYPRGPRVVVRLGARGTQRLTNRLRLALEPECLENPTATARENPQRRNGLD